MRLSLINLIFAVTVGACAPVAASRPSDDAPVIAMVYNIHAGKDAAGIHNLQRVADAVQSAGADLVLLQEVDRFTRRSGGEDQIARLAALTRMHSAFGNTLDYQGGQYGIALLSRWPIIRDTLFPLPIDPPQTRADGSYEPRGALYAAIDLGRDTLHVFNTHLDAGRDDQFRRQEARVLLQLVRPLLDRGAAVLVGGDLNATPESAVIALLTADRLADAWTRCGSGDGFSFPDSLPIRRIDYLLLSPGLSCSAATVLNAHASDHRALRVRIIASR